MQQRKSLFQEVAKGGGGEKAQISLPDSDWVGF